MKPGGKRRAPKAGVCDCGEIGWVALTHGHVTLVSPQDVPALSERCWAASAKRQASGKLYVRAARRCGRTRKVLYLHRFILGDIPSDRHVDHIDRDPLNNRRENLRLCDTRQNSWNTSSDRYRGASGFRGVTMDQGRWVARIKTIDGVTRFIGSFATEVEAALAFDLAALAMRGEWAALNFPEIANPKQERDVA